MYVILIIVTTLVLCLLANTMANVIERVSPDLRTISSGQSWLSIIPVFGTFWIFYAVQQTSNMLSEEFQRRKIVEFETHPGLAVGWGFSFILFCAQLTLLIDATTMTLFLYIGAIITLIVYWVKLAGFKTKLDNDLMRQHTQRFQHPFQQNTPHPFPEHPQHYPSTPDFPPQPPAPPVNEWDRWKPK